MAAKTFLAGLLTDKQSIATGIMLALIAWTLTRLIDGVTTSGTIEYDVAFTPTKLASGEPATRIEVKLSNLSNEVSVENLRAVISDPRGKTTFSEAVGDFECAFEPPAWASGGVCEPDSRGINFQAPMLVPGTYARVAVKYTQAEGATGPPIVRIRPGNTGNSQLVEPGIRTFIVRHEVALLMVLLGVGLVLFVFSLAAAAPKLTGE